MRRTLLAALICALVAVPAAPSAVRPAAVGIVVRDDAHAAQLADPAAATIVPLAARTGPSTAPTHERHGLGLALPGVPVHAARIGRARPATYRTPGSLPPAVDLSRYDPPVGDQGNVGSCVAWSQAYNLRGWYARRDGAYPAGGFAPMSEYYHIVADYDGGQDRGATLQQGLDTQVAYGINSASEYPQGPFDYTTPPSAAEAAQALARRLPSYTTLFSNELLGGGAPGIAAAQRALAGGTPVVLAIAVFPALMQATAADPLVSDTSGPVLGGHAIMAVGYDAAGVWIENQWGTGYGRAGYAELSYGYLEAALVGVATIAPVAPAPATDTPVPPTPVPSSTATPSPSSSPTVTPSPSPTPAGLVPWPHPAAPPLPAGLPKGTYRVTLIVTDSAGRTRAMAWVRVVR